MPAVASLPSLSQLLAWPTEHLTDAADRWDAVAARNYGVANQIWQDALSIDWHGDAADALRAATHSDMITVSVAVDQLQAAAKVARSGASDLCAARARLLYALEDAQTAGFDVDDNMSVGDRSTGGSAILRAARQAAAEAFAADIRQRATQLVAVDQQVAEKVTAAVDGIRDVFAQNPTPSTQKPDIQAVDHHWKKDPAPQPDPSGDEPWENLPSPHNAQDIKDALRQLPRGENKPHRQLDTPEQIQDFWDWLAKNARPLPPSGKVTRKILDDGTEISVRPGSGSGGPTIEAVLPGPGKTRKVHLPLPFIDIPPDLPPLHDHPPMTPSPPAPGHPLPIPLPPTQFADPADLPSWLKDPSPPGFTVSPVQQPPVFDWDRPDAPAPPVAHAEAPPQGGESWLPGVAHDLSEGGKAVFGWVIVGGVLVWGVLSGAGRGGEASAP